MIFIAYNGDWINNTLTILLLASTLYIVIFQSYHLFESYDHHKYYFIALFALLFCICLLHFAVTKFKTNDKQQKFQMKIFYVRFVEFIGRVVIIPIIVYTYFSSFDWHYSYNIYIAALSILGIFSLLIFVRECKSLYKVYTSAIKED